MRALTPLVGSLAVHGLCLGVAVGGLGGGTAKALGQHAGRAAWVPVQVEPVRPAPTPRPASSRHFKPAGADTAALHGAASAPLAPASAIADAGEPPSDAGSLILLKTGGRPQYPSASRRNGEEGEVAVKLRIGPQGDVLDAALARSSGHPRLDASALVFLRQAKFEVPPSLASLGTPIEKTFSVVFELSQRDSQ